MDFLTSVEQRYKAFREQMVKFSAALEKAVNDNQYLPSVRTQVEDSPPAAPTVLLTQLGRQFRIGFSIHSAEESFGAALEVTPLREYGEKPAIAAAWYFDRYGNVKQKPSDPVATWLITDPQFLERLLVETARWVLQDASARLTNYSAA